jgi:hypothetical protein
MALLMTMGSMVIIGALVAGAFFVSTRDVRTARAAGRRESAQMQAENALFQARQRFASIPPTDAQLPIGGVMNITTPVTGFGSGTAQMTRVSQNVFILTSLGQKGAGAVVDSARNRASMVLVRNVPNMNFLGALTVRGATQIGGSSFIDGHDSDPSGWACPEPQLAQKPGVVTPPPGTNITFSGCNSGSCIDGNPDIQQNSAAADDATYFSYGSVGWNELKARAMTVPSGNMKIQPSVTGSTCNTGVLTNWGDPLRSGGACEGYFPIIYVNGDANINGVRGQGVLLVEGDLQVQGGFEFYGPVIVKGRLKTTGTGGHFNGGVMAANVELEQNQVLGNAVISFSNCAIKTALNASAPLVPVRQRAWADLF